MGNRGGRNRAWSGGAYGAKRADSPDHGHCRFLWAWMDSHFSEKMLWGEDVCADCRGDGTCGEYRKDPILPDVKKDSAGGAKMKEKEWEQWLYIFKH